jgi:hypothetical protein
MLAGHLLEDQAHVVVEPRQNPVVDELGAKPPGDLRPVGGDEDVSAVAPRQRGRNPQLPTAWYAPTRPPAECGTHLPFPSYSAARLRETHERGQGSRPHAIVAVSQRSLKAILAAIGPIEIEGGLTVDAEGLRGFLREGIEPLASPTARQSSIRYRPTAVRGPIAWRCHHSTDF